MVIVGTSSNQWFSTSAEILEWLAVMCPLEQRHFRQHNGKAIRFRRPTVDRVF